MAVRHGLHTGRKAICVFHQMVKEKHKVSEALEQNQDEEDRLQTCGLKTGMWLDVGVDSPVRKRSSSGRFLYDFCGEDGLRAPGQLTGLGSRGLWLLISLFVFLAQLDKGEFSFETY